MRALTNTFSRGVLPVTVHDGFTSMHFCMGNNMAGRITSYEHYANDDQHALMSLGMNREVFGENDDSLDAEMMVRRPARLRQRRRPKLGVVAGACEIEDRPG